MNHALIDFYQKKFVDFEKILERYGLTQLDIKTNTNKENKSWVISGTFNDCNNFCSCLRAMEFQDPYPDLSLLDIDVWDLKVFFAKLRTLKTDHDEIGKLVRFCIDHSRALHHLSHQIYIHIVSSSTSPDHVMAVFYLMADILINSKFAEAYTIAFGVRLPFIMIYLYRIFTVLCDTSDSMGFILRIKHVLWILDQNKIYSAGFIGKMYNIFMGLFEPKDNTLNPIIWKSYMFENLTVMNNFMVFTPHEYLKLQHNPKFQLHKVEESGFRQSDKAEESPEDLISKKFLPFLGLKRISSMFPLLRGRI